MLVVMSDPDASSDIPEEFWSAYTEQPFDRCVECDKSLNDDLLPYAIQKHFVAGEAVFEMAICIECARRLQESFSEESRKAIESFIREAPERQRRQQEAEDATLIDLEGASAATLARQLGRLEQAQRVRRERALGSCAICAKLKNECHRYSLGTACLGGSLITGAPDSENLGSPFLICENCEQGLNECVSAQTRDAWDRFVEENFDGPPELAVDPRDLVAIF